MTNLQACSSGFPESRYYVIKESDLYEAQRSGLVTLSQMAALVDVKTATEDVRRMSHKTSLQTLIIEKDWLEYQPTLSLIARRVLSELNAADVG